MDVKLQALAATQDHVILRPQLLAAGYTDDEIARLRRHSQLTAVRRGAYVETRIWNGMDPAGRHRATARAVVMQLKVPAVPSHITAAVILGLPIWGVDLSVVHVTRTDLHSPRLEAGVMHHAAGLWDGDVCSVSGVVVTSPLRTALDVARSVPFEQGVVVADGALRRVGNDRKGLLEKWDVMRTWPGARGAGRVVAFADGGAESVGESRARVQFDRIGLPAPRLQPVITGPNGEIFRADFLFEEEVTIGEFDGRSKYLGNLGPDDDPADVLWREKQREDILRNLGFGVARLVWADLSRDAEVLARFSAAFRQAGRRRAARALH
ncbi:type IV toxin-antitoxin system AbiEi family antitoxin domain-containing protein [Phytoactinopolyspora alkaliphila]|uniref:Type IV toxin-antitoxin system AbiEi family antitoxin domain-containing protein n=1 Tax=Phytoactinopolyspora alkaliphila TaxID=1783498 RepID=A0A6N9YLE2_9ACTN|nr:type IV toxin-antitoxin system AbiEi family antitoxin domain-containing protein [Phytoactinopolyspora alkaliphila]NED95668.1 type IV toxin-antitoxin system AbiEi family antitoxin domain-containing protein [Phytoactinopolyspora alkaliphila]